MNSHQNRRKLSIFEHGEANPLANEKYFNSGFKSAKNVKNNNNDNKKLMKTDNIQFDNEYLRTDSGSSTQSNGQNEFKALLFNSSLNDKKKLERLSSVDSANEMDDTIDNIDENSSFQTKIKPNFRKLSDLSKTSIPESPKSSSESSTLKGIPVSANSSEESSLLKKESSNSFNDSKKLKKRQKSLIEHKPKHVFVELLELKPVQDNDLFETFYEWKETSRWIKYEQDVDSNGSWSKPCVGTLLYQSLLYLKTGLKYGTVLLDADCESLDQIMDEALQDFIDSGHMSKENKDEFKHVIFGRYFHQLKSSSRKHSIISEVFTNNRRSFADPKLIVNSKAQPTLNENEENVNLDNIPRPLNKSRRSTLAMLTSIKNTVIQMKTNRSLKTSDLDDEAEACIILVGVVDFLDRPVMAFIRLREAQYFEGLVEMQLKVRFMFILLGPKSANVDYLEIGRCMGTLMGNPEFHDSCYTALDRREVIDSITKFINQSLCIILPIGDFDNETLTPIIEWLKEKLAKKKKRILYNSVRVKRQISVKANTLHKMESNEDYDENTNTSNKAENEFDPFKRTNCLFGGLLQEMKTRYCKYFNDIQDGCNLQCFFAIIFIFTVCFSPALTFGGILSDKTDKWMGINEMLLATSIGGIVFGMFSGQPLMILGPTGPFLIFEEMLYIVCQKTFCIEFLPTRFWVSVWVLIMTLGMVAFQGIFIIHYVTRFAEEIFAFLVAWVFLIDAFKKVYYIFKTNPLNNLYSYCNHTNHKLSNQNIASNRYNLSANETDNAKSNQTFCIFNDNEDKQYGYNPNPEPNIALLSLILFIGTCAIALLFRKLRKTQYFTSLIRHTLSDVGILIAIMSMVFVDDLIQTHTGIKLDKVDIPATLTPTKSKMRTEWFVNPIGNKAIIPVWVPFACILPALLIFIVLFLEVELTGIMLNAKHRKLRRGTGFHLDLLLSAILMVINSLFGLPWMCAAPVNTLAHWASLTVYSRTRIPGEKPKLTMIIEQRITNIFVHVAIGLTLFTKGFLQSIPVCVLFGIFLYFGIVSLSGTQLFERIKLIFKPSKYRPNMTYARAARPLKRNLFTIIQLLGVVILLILKSIINLSFLFPVVLVLLVPFRKFILPKLFSNKELEQLDEEEEDVDDTDTCYDIFHLGRHVI